METIITKHKLDVKNIEDSWKTFCSQRPSFDVFQATKNLIDVTKIYMIFDVKVFAIYGTLLGVIRNKSLIMHDTDVDLGFFNNDVESIIKAHSLMLFYGFRLLRNDSENRLITYERNGQYIDFYKFEITSQLPSNSVIAFFFPVNSILPLREEFLTEGLVFIPHKHIKIIRRLYGNNWLIEKKEAHFPSDTLPYRLYENVSKFIPLRFLKILKFIIKFFSILISKLKAGLL